MFRLSNFCLALLFVSLQVNAQYLGKIYRISFNGQKSDIRYYIKRAELDNLRSGILCGEYYYPVRKTKWRCKRASGGLACQAYYKCQKFTAGTDLESEINKLEQQLKKIPPRSTDPRVDIEEVSRIDPSFGKNTKKKKKKRAVKKERQRVKKKIEKKEKPKPKKKKKKKVKEKKDPWKYKYQLLGFKTSLSYISDSSGGGLYTLLGGWRPRMIINDKYFIGLLISGHSLNATNSDTNQLESFLVFDYGLRLGAFVSDFYISLGPGSQKWNDSRAESFSTFNFGGGYVFKEQDRLWGFINDLSLHYHKISTEEAHQEIRLGAGIVF